MLLPGDDKWICRSRASHRHLELKIHLFTNLIIKTGFLMTEKEESHISGSNYAMS